jgi:hypothetical protein
VQEVVPYDYPLTIVRVPAGFAKEVGGEVERRRVIPLDVLLEAIAKPH